MKRRIIAAAAFVLAFSAGAASAQTMSFAEAGGLIAKSCGPSIEKFCSKDNVGTGQIQPCLSKHEDTVPRQCFIDLQNAAMSIDKRMAAQKDVFTLCEADAREYCKGVKPGDANLLDCLLTASKVVKGTCKQALVDAGWAN